MRLPSRTFAEASLGQFAAGRVVAIGCLNFEERCTAVPQLVSSSFGETANLYLFGLIEPQGGVPDYSEERKDKTEKNRLVLKKAGVKWSDLERPTLCSEDDLLSDITTALQPRPQTLVLDITALPKRVFCFLLRRVLVLAAVPNVVVTYTEAGEAGYTTEHLAADVMTPEMLPGFAGRLVETESNLVASIGFEALGLRDLILSLYREDNANLRIVLPFPAPLETVRRQWSTLREIMEGDAANMRKDSVAVIGAWDAEQVYRRLALWAGNGERLSLAPYGPKPHTLGMALFAIKHECSMWYTQPRVYHPNYSLGTGVSRWYVVKWSGVTCFDRA